MKMKRLLSVLLTAALVSALFAPAGSAEETEELAEAAVSETEEAAEEAEEDTADGADEIVGIVPWGAGGQTDTLMRALGSIVVPALDKGLNIQNMPGNTGADGLAYVYEQASDGSTLLMSAENPALYHALMISDLDYDDFTCILLVGDETTGVIVGPDSPYESLTDIVNAALSGETVTLAGTGVGGLPWNVAMMIYEITGAEFERVDYDGDASAKEAVANGECDFTISKLGAAVDDHDAGLVNYVCVIADEPVDPLPDVPAVTDEYPEFENYLPWAPFSGVFVKNDTDSATVESLTEAFSQAYQDDQFQTILAYNYVNGLGYSGDEAAEYIRNWSEETSTMLQEIAMEKFLGEE